jgi:hypothetical protein
MIFVTPVMTAFGGVGSIRPPRARRDHDDNQIPDGASADACAPEPDASAGAAGGP